MKSTLFASFILLSGLAHAASAFVSCDELDVGESMAVHNKDGRSRSKIGQTYALKRVDDVTYEAYINLEFYDYEEEKEKYGKIPLPQDQEHTIRKNLKRCYEQMSSAMKDEHGRLVKIKLFDAEKDLDIPVPAVHKVWYSTAFQRANSSLYYSTMRCDVAVHEAYHILGLVDEYKEEWKEINSNLFQRMFGQKYVPNADGVERPIYDCRAKTNPKSMMSNNIQIFSAHVNAIIYPNCEEKNEIYFACIKNSLKTSRKNLKLPVPLPVGGCAKMPDICYTEDWIKIQQH